MAHQHYSLFNPDSNYDFVGRRHVYYALTGVGILASIIALSTLGFNKGIDFKGGTKQIVAFDPAAKVDRVGLQGTVEGILTTALGSSKVGDVEVQEFDTGTGGGSGKKHFAVVTELTSMLTKAKRDGIEKGLIFSYPIRSNGKDFEIVQGVPLNDFSKAKIAATENELKEEKSLVADLIKK